VVKGHVSVRARETESHSFTLKAFVKKSNAFSSLSSSSRHSAASCSSSYLTVCYEDAPNHTAHLNCLSLIVTKLHHPKS
jgi:hypothetical protein